ncbi:hypothetical protein PHET_08476 [Paragonimus heterotremus]|uniref:Uncharacterized protein n=1 Tax=Paragonimus heterotremus TaxID=100268 RepID=A0A8J4SHI8_9TREM|nr:hypothetical protein PHET_08476 [Paragonimus heterotremus]
MATYPSVIISFRCANFTGSTVQCSNLTVLVLQRREAVEIEILFCSLKFLIH